MISNKALATLFLITLNIHLIASTTPKDTPEPSPSGESTPLVRKRRPELKTSEVLNDATNNMGPVEFHGGSTGEVEISQEQPAPQRKSGPGFFETLMNRRQHERICYFAKRIGKDKFLKHIYPLVKTFEQYNGIVSCLKRHNLVASFYVFGDIEVVKKAIIAEPKGCTIDGYNFRGDLEKALPLALENDNHDCNESTFRVRFGARDDYQLI